MRTATAPQDAPLSAPLSAPRRRIALLLMLASGFAGLGYQIVWTQQFSLWLGHETAAVLAVVAGFFGGLAVGALGLGTRIECSSRPLRWYVVCELLIALWSLALALLMPQLGTVMLALIGEQPSPVWQWTVSFGGTFLLLLPATAAMGATLPAMERMGAQMALGAVGRRSIAALYASNTLGAVIGVLATAFWLVPGFGLSRTAGVCVALNLFCAAAALLAFAPRSNLAAPAGPVAPAEAVLARGLLARLFLSGLLGIGYEVMVVRVLSQVAEDTVYTFALLLAVYLTGTAIGAAAYQRWLLRHGDAKRIGDRLFCALAVACLIGTASLWEAEQVRESVLVLAGAGMASALAAEAALALTAFALPTLVMGALFSHLCAGASRAGLSFGRCIGVNTLGACAAPLLFGVLLAPLLGPKFALLLIAAGYLALMRWGAWIRPIMLLPATAVAALALWTPPLAFIDMPEGGRLISYQDGAMAAVSVVEDGNGVARLRINNRQQEGSSSSLYFDARQALLPLLLHPDPHRALFLGLGTGMTASAAAQDPTLQVDAVELLPEVIRASEHFTRAAETGNARLHILSADARRYVRASEKRYDVIVSDNFHPARSGSGALYTVEHFQAVRQRLAAQGLFCQWLPLHQLDLASLRSVVQAFMQVYPGGTAILASNSLETPVIGLIGHADATPVPELRLLRARLAGAAWPEGIARFGVEDELALLGTHVAGPTALRRFAGDAVANTDDQPVVSYRAPRLTYAPDSLPRDRLFALLDELAVEPAQVVNVAADSAFAARLAAYWSARRGFVEAGREVRPSADVQQMLAQVREPLLAVLRTSPDFRPAYDPLLRMAAALARSDAPAARLLLSELVQAQPARAEAQQLLAELASK